VQVCDNEWHHYAINVRFPNVELFVDGAAYKAADGRGPEVIDDWPLHPAHGLNTTLVVGACWQGNFHLLLTLTYRRSCKSSMC
jgi:calsyntenin 1